MTVPLTGQPYSALIGGAKSVKDGVMLVAALIGAVALANLTGIANQCPDATITIGGMAIGLKVVLQFINNYRKNA